MEYDINDTSIGLDREHAALAWLRANDPVHWDAKNQAWLITRNADVREVLHHARHSRASTRPWRPRSRPPASSAPSRSRGRLASCRT